MVRTSFFSQLKHSRFWKTAGGIEGFKFALYLGIPVAASVFYANADFMHKLILDQKLISYPEEGKKPPTADELAAHIQKLKASR